MHQVNNSLHPRLEQQRKIYYVLTQKSAFWLIEKIDPL